MLTDIKKCLHVNTAELADFLGISPAMMASISSDRRAWRFDCLQLTTRLYDALGVKTPLDELEGAAAFFEGERLEAQYALETAIKKLKRTLDLIKKQLTRLMSDRQLWLRGLLACDQLIITELSSHERQWIHMRKKKLRAKLEENSRVKMNSLEVQIMGLEAQVDLLQRLIDQHQ